MQLTILKRLELLRICLLKALTDSQSRLSHLDSNYIDETWQSFLEGLINRMPTDM